MRINMTIDECLEFADEWARGCTFHEGSQGWRVVCMLLAVEVRKNREALERIALNISGDTPAQVIAGEVLRPNVQGHGTGAALCASSTAP